MKGRAAAFALGLVIAAIVASGASASAATVWLCRPGLAHNPCLSSMTTTVIDAHGRRTVQHSRPAAHPAIDCFYVYPTVSLQSTTNANLVIDPQETAVEDRRGPVDRGRQHARPTTEDHPTIGGHVPVEEVVLGVEEPAALR